MSAPAERPQVARTGVKLSLGGAELTGELTAPAGATADVLVTPGSGPHSRGSRVIAGRLQAGGFTTLVMDLLTPGERRQRKLLFDVDWLAERLQGVTAWLRGRSGDCDCRLGVVVAATQAAAALQVAAQQESEMAALVCLCGRPDLAGVSLPRVTAPTLLVVGGEDGPVLEFNRRASRMLRCACRLEVLPDWRPNSPTSEAEFQVAEHAHAWLSQHLTPVEC